jgi:AraC-like DNA-binding protein
VPEREWRAIWRTDFAIDDALPGLPQPLYAQRHLYWDDEWCYRGTQLPRATNWQFTWTVSGLAEITRDGVVHAAPPGTGFLYRLADPGFAMATAPGRSDPWVFLHFSFVGADALAAAVLARIGPVVPVAPGHAVIAAIERWRRGLRGRQPLSRLDGAQLVNAFLDQLAEVGRERPPPAEALVRRGERLLWRRCDSGIGVAELARGCGVSAEHLARCWRARRGVSPHAAIVGERLARASALLRETPLPVADIARRCGFVSASHFARAFRQRYGSSPRRFRANGDRA